MTPWGIRKRIKGALGRGATPGSADIVQHAVTYVLPDGTEHTIQAEEHYTLAMASQFLPSPIDTPCPDGQCGQCAVDILVDRGLEAASSGEVEVMQKWHKQAPGKKRLACHCRVGGPGAKVKVHRLFDFDAVKGE
ncbi:MAG: 2Fe-2S iron-sulfur cluster binding domain-containing protein [Alphaproteobacteria bacterium]|nr:2Fe-2S iron-sulfur cluster binding domain-containing protein [Alphaproteobacteria bacterium]